MKCHECGSDEHLRRSCPKLHHHVQPSVPAATPTTGDQTLTPGTMYMQQHFYQVGHVEPEAEASTGNYAPSFKWQQSVSEAMGVTDREGLQDRQLRNLMIMSQTDQSVPEQQQTASASDHTVIEQLRILDNATDDGSRVSALFFPWWDLSQVHTDLDNFNTADLNHEQIFLLKTKLPGEGREGLLVDTGAHDNLVGNLFVKRMLNILEKQGLLNQVKWQKLSKPINVSGVGKHSQVVDWQVTLPLKVIVNDAPGDTTYTAPVVGTDDEPSTVPALWGIKSMRKQRAVIDLVNNEVHLCGPGRVRVDTPHDTSTMKIEDSLSKHPLLPCTEFEKAAKKIKTATATIHGFQSSVTVTKEGDGGSSSH